MYAGATGINVIDGESAVAPDGGLRHPVPVCTSARHRGGGDAQAREGHPVPLARAAFDTPSLAQHEPHLRGTAAEIDVHPRVGGRVIGVAGHDVLGARGRAADLERPRRVGLGGQGLHPQHGVLARAEEANRGTRDRLARRLHDRAPDEAPAAHANHTHVGGAAGDDPRRGNARGRSLGRDDLQHVIVGGEVFEDEPPVGAGDVFLGLAFVAPLGSGRAGHHPVGVHRTIAFLHDHARDRPSVLEHELDVVGARGNVLLDAREAGRGHVNPIGPRAQSGEDERTVGLRAGVARIAAAVGPRLEGAKRRVRHRLASPGAEPAPDGEAGLEDHVAGVHVAARDLDFDAPPGEALGRHRENERPGGHALDAEAPIRARFRAEQIDE